MASGEHDEPVTNGDARHNQHHGSTTSAGKTHRQQPGVASPAMTPARHLPAAADTAVRTGAANGFLPSSERARASRDSRYQPSLERVRQILVNMHDGGDLMPIDKFEFWFRAIQRDDHEFVRRILTETSDKQELTKLMNGRFVYAYEPVTSVQRKMPCVFDRPLVLAVVFCSLRTAKLFVNHGADIFVQDRDSSTIIHALIWAAVLKPSNGSLYVDTYDAIMMKLSPDQRRHLLFIENTEGLRPLELAARSCTFDLFLRILDTEGVYMSVRGMLGAHLSCWYDVTDYESWEHGKRKDRSPLKIFTLMEKEHLRRAISSGLTRHCAVEQWIHTKITINIPYLIMWFLIRLAYSILVYVCIQGHYDDEGARFRTTNVTNGTDATPHCPRSLFHIPFLAFAALRITVVIFSLVMLLFDVADCLTLYRSVNKTEKRCHHPFGSRNFVVRTRFYRICNMLLALSVLGYQLAYYIDNQISATKMHMLCTILNIWSLLFFLQLVPALGYFVIIIQRMLKDLWHFVLLYLILFFSFSQAFYNLFQTSGECVPHFSTVTHSMYSTFRIMLNLVDLTTYSQVDLLDVAMLHVMYTVAVSLLLINFFIALLAHSVSDVAENRHIIMQLQRLSAAILVERRFSPLMRVLYRWHQKSRLVVQDGRLYLECFIFQHES